MIPENNRINHIVISAQVLSYYISEMKATNYFKGTLLNFVNKFITQLKLIEWKYFDKMFDKETEASTVVYEVYDNYIKTISNIPIWEMQNVINILDAYNKDAKSIEGVVSKVLKYKKD